MGQSISQIVRCKEKIGIAFLVHLKQAKIFEVEQIGACGLIRHIVCTLVGVNPIALAGSSEGVRDDRLLSMVEPGA